MVFECNISLITTNQCKNRGRGATLKLGEGGGHISDSIVGGTIHFFLLTLYNFKNIVGGGGAHGP